MPTMKIAAEGIEQLEFTPDLPCRYCDEAPATHVVRCRTYPAAHRLACCRCLAQLVAGIAAAGSPTCSACGAVGAQLDDLAEVLDL